MEYKSNQIENREFFKIDKGRVRANLVSELWVGGGNTTFRVNREGVFAGADNYSDAPFKISYTGVLSATGSITSGSSTGSQIILDNSTGSIKFKYNGSEKGSIIVSSEGNMTINYDDDCYLGSDSDQAIRLLENGNVELRHTGGYIGWISGRKFTDKSSYIECDGDFIATSGIRADSYSVKPDSTTYSGETATGVGFVTSVRLNDGDIERKYREITVRGGIVTDISSESDWT